MTTATPPPESGAVSTDEPETRPMQAPTGSPRHAPAANGVAGAASPDHDGDTTPADDSAAAVEGRVAPRTAGDASRHPRRRWLTVLKVVGWVILLPIIAVGIGLLVAWIVHEIRGHHVASAPRSAAASTPPAAPSASAKPKSPVVTTPADWVAEDAPPVGVTFKHPAGWIRRTSAPEVLRFAPVASGSTSPGVDGVGAGVEPAATPAQALQDFATRAYGGQPGFTVSAAAAPSGPHAGEVAETVTYRRSGVEVQVVLHGFRSGERTVLVLGRAAAAQPGRAAQLESFTEASLQAS